MLHVLLVDPSREFRDSLGKALEQAEDIHVVDALAHKDAALTALAYKSPDVVIFDIEIPDAYPLLEEIQKINEKNPGDRQVGVILIARRKLRDADNTIKALEKGAFDFVLKPETFNQPEVIKSLSRQFFVKMRNFASKRIFCCMAEARLSQQGAAASEGGMESLVPDSAPVSPGRGARIRAVIIGVSTGGPKTLAMILPELCMVTDLPICIVQHMPPNFTASLAASLNAKCRHTVCEAAHGDRLEHNTVYIAPGGLHMRLARSNDGVRLRLTDDPPEDGCRPSVNVFFRSAVEVLRGNVVAVVLTGMGADGSKGVQELKKAGAYIIAQDKASSVVWGMPGSAVATGSVDKILPPREIPKEIRRVLQGDPDVA